MQSHLPARDVSDQLHLLQIHGVELSLRRYKLVILFTDTWSEIKTAQV